MAARWLVTGWNIFEWFSAWFFLFALLSSIHEHGNQINIWTRDRDWAMAWSNWSAIYNQMSKCNLQRFQKSKWSFLFQGMILGQCSVSHSLWYESKQCLVLSSSVSVSGSLWSMCFCLIWHFCCNYVKLQLSRNVKIRLFCRGKKWISRCEPSRADFGF